MYVNIAGSSNNKDVYIYQSFRKENGKTSSHIYKKSGKLNDLIAQFDNDRDKMMEWAKNEAKKEIGNGFTRDQISQALRSMQMTLLNTAGGYIPSYTRTELTDILHQRFGFHTDYEIITKASIRTIILNTKVMKKTEI